MATQLFSKIISSRNLAIKLPRYISDEIQHRENMYFSRSMKWQQSDKGKRHKRITHALGDALNSAHELINDLNTAIYMPLKVKDYENKN